MATETAETYERLPYRKLAHTVSHPGRLHALLKLAGGDPPPVSTGRILELGCAAGWNVLPLAAAYPDATIIGTDFSASQIAEGEAAIEATGIKNIELRAADIREIDESWGTFDYIICHGVYSWVPEAVRNKILEIGRDRLSARGAMQVSYNVYPRWKLRELMREMMMVHVAQQTEPMDEAASVAKGLEAVEHVVKYMAAGELKEALRQEYEKGGIQGDAAYVFHEYLEPDNVAFYFHEFAADIKAVGLTHALDSITELGAKPGMPDVVRQWMAPMAPTQREQFQDFMFGRAFRSSVLVHEGTGVGPVALPDRMKDARIVLRVKPDVGTIILGKGKTFTTKINDRDWSLRSSIGRAALRQLVIAFPEPISFSTLHQRAKEMLEPVEGDFDTSEDTLLETVLSGYDASALEFFFDPPKVTSTISDTPVVSPFARFQASAGPDVTSLLHRRETLDTLAQHLIPLLDGTKDRDALIEATQAACDRGDIEFAGGTPKRDKLGQWVDMRLHRARDAGILIG